MQTLQLSITLPFSYYLEQDAAAQTRLLRFPSPNMIRAYMEALSQEIDLLADDVRGQVTIDAVRFTSGYLHLIKPETLDAFLRKLRDSFDFTPDCKWIALACPGYLAPLKTVLSRYPFQIVLDVPTLDRQEAQSCMLPFGPAFDPPALNDDPLEIIGLRILNETDYRTPETYAALCQRLLSIAPPRIETISFGGGTCQNAGFLAMRNAFLSAGYEEVEPETFAKPEGYVRHRQHTQAMNAYLGIGLSAATLYDGFYTKNTSDFNQYLRVERWPYALYTEKREVADIQ